MEEHWEYWASSIKWSPNREVWHRLSCSSDRYLGTLGCACQGDGNQFLLSSLLILQPVRRRTFSQVMQPTYLLTRAEQLGSEALEAPVTHCWCIWRLLLSLCKANSPRASLLVLHYEFHLQHKQTQSTNLLICTILQILKCILYTSHRKKKLKTKQYIYCFIRKGEQLRTWVLLLPPWTNWWLMV